jgi:hypothetical protein
MAFSPRFPDIVSHGKPIHHGNACMSYLIDKRLYLAFLVDRVVAVIAGRIVTCFHGRSLIHITIGAQKSTCMTLLIYASAYSIIG